MSRGDLKEETESEIIAAHDQAVQTKYHATKILQTETDSKCRLCKLFDVSVRPILAKEQYVKRHDRVCALLHYHIYKEIGVKLDNKHWHDHVPKSFETGHEGQQVRTDRTIRNNKPDIINSDNKQGHAR